MSGATTAARDGQIRVRLAQDLLAGGLAATWERRALMFEWAAPRASDYLGAWPNDDRIATQAQRAAARAQACRNLASWIREHDGALPTELNDLEQWVADNFLSWMAPTAVDTPLETTTEMIARHRRVVSVLDHASMRRAA